jgi:hypothetical protein
MAQTLGIIDIMWLGQKLAVKKGAKAVIGGLKQNPVIVGQQVDYANEMVASVVTATKSFRRGDQITGLYAGGTGELQVMCDTGQTYVWADAFLSNRPSLTGGEGDLELEWTAGVPQELLNG